MTSSRRRACLVALLAALAAVAAMRPLYHAPESTAARDAAALEPWPDEFEGVPLRPAPLHPVEARFGEAFPGTFAAFTDGRRRIVFRRIMQPTRKVHPAGDCLRAAGYAVRPAPAQRHPETGLWGVVRATKDGRVYQVREHIVDASGARAWTDVSAWYWSALVRPGDGPWLAITVIEPASPQARLRAYHAQTSSIATGQ